MFLVSSVRAQDLIGAASLLLDLSYITQLDQEAQPHHHVEWVLYIPNDVLWQVGGDTVSNNVIIMRAVTYLTERGDNIPPLTISIFSLFLQDSHIVISQKPRRALLSWAPVLVASQSWRNCWGAVNDSYELWDVMWGRRVEWVGGTHLSRDGNWIDLLYM